MPKHNIDAIARVAYEAKRAWAMGSGAYAQDADAAPEPWDNLQAEDQRAVRADVLEAIHGTPKDDEGGTVEEQRHDRLFQAIVKALTVRL